MKITKKMLILIIIALIISIFFSTRAYATWDVAGSLRNALLDPGKNVDPNGRPARVFVTIIRAVEVAASFFCVAKLSWVGIKYFTASAASEKAQTKGEIVRALLLAAGIFGASAIIELLYRMFIY